MCALCCWVLAGSASLSSGSCLLRNTSVERTRSLSSSRFTLLVHCDTYLTAEKRRAQAALHSAVWRARTAALRRPARAHPLTATRVVCRPIHGRARGPRRWPCRWPAGAYEHSRAPLHSARSTGRCVRALCMTPSHPLSADQRPVEEVGESTYIH